MNAPANPTAARRQAERDRVRAAFVAVYAPDRPAPEPSVSDRVGARTRPVPVRTATAARPAGKAPA